MSAKDTEFFERDPARKVWPFRNGTNTRLLDVVGRHSIRPCLVAY